MWEVLDTSESTVYDIDFLFCIEMPPWRVEQFDHVTTIFITEMTTIIVNGYLKTDRSFKLTYIYQIYNEKFGK